MSVAEILDFRQAKDELFADLKKMGALAAGVADAADFGEAPAGHRPADLLPGAQRVLVIGASPPRSGDWNSPNYRHQETMGASDRVNQLGKRIASMIEERYGYYALFVSPGLSSAGQPYLSLQMAAEKAGCGARSLAGPVLHPEHGFLFFSAIVTTMPLPADPPLASAPCPAPECLEQWEAEGTTPCLAVCPIDDGGCLGGKIADGRVVERQYDCAKCATRSQTYWHTSFQKIMETALNEPDHEARKMIFYSSLFTRTLWAMTYASQSHAQCYECMRVCPVGRKRGAEK